MALLMFCPHCEASHDQLPNWQHVERAPDAQGVTEHLWWAIYTEAGTRFAVGVSVKRHPSDAQHFGGRPSITWKMRLADVADSSSCEAMATTVAGAAIAMVGEDRNNDQPSKLQVWARNITRIKAWLISRGTPAQPVTPAPYVPPF